MYTIHSAKQMHQQHPDTFEIPDAKDLHKVTIGNSVKLIFRTEDGEEHMWVKITHRSGIFLKGTLSCHPIDIPDLTCGDDVVFTTDNICCINNDNQNRI